MACQGVGAHDGGEGLEVTFNIPSYDKEFPYAPLCRNTPGACTHHTHNTPSTAGTGHARATRRGRGNPAPAGAPAGAALSRGVFPRGALELDRTARARIYLPHLTDRYRLALGSVSRQTQPAARTSTWAPRTRGPPAGALSIENIYQREREML